MGASKSEGGNSKMKMVNFTGTELNFGVVVVDKISHEQEDRF